jgi:hypothetical protein
MTGTCTLMTVPGRSLDGTALPPQVKGAMATIWGELIPASGLAVADSPGRQGHGRQGHGRQGAAAAPIASRLTP